MGFALAPTILPSRGRRVALIGTSISSYNLYCSPALGSYNNQYNPNATEVDFGAQGYLTAFQQRYRKFYHDPAMNFGLPGDTTTQMLARYPSNIAANYVNFDILFIEGGVNDAPNSISSAATAANLQAMANQALAAGKAVVILGILPRTGWGSATGTQQTQYSKQNIYTNRLMAAWARSFSPSAPLFWVDPWRDLCDPQGTATTGNINANAFIDGLHLSNLGADLVAQRINAVCGALWPTPQFGGYGDIDAYDSTYNPYGNLIASNAGLHTTTGGSSSNVSASGGVPSGWAASQVGTTTAPEVTYATVSGDGVGFDARTGNIARLTAAIASGKGAVSTIRFRRGYESQSNFSAGDVVAFHARVNVSGAANLANVRAVLAYTPDGGATSYIRYDGAQNTSTYIGPQDSRTVYLETPRLVIPVGSQSNPLVLYGVYIDLDARTGSAAGQFDITDLQLRKTS